MIGRLALGVAGAVTVGVGALMSKIGVQLIHHGYNASKKK